MEHDGQEAKAPDPAAERVFTEEELRDKPDDWPYTPLAERQAYDRQRAAAEQARSSRTENVTKCDSDHEAPR